MKPIDNFRPQRRICKSCERNYSKLWRKRNVEYRHNYQQKWYQDHKEHVCDYDKKRRLTPEVKQQEQEYWLDYYQKNKEKILARHRENRQKHTEAVKRFARTPKGRINQKKQKYARRARLRNCKVNDLSQRQISNLFLNSRSCKICGKKFNKKRKKTIDHIVPISKGGNNTFMNVWVVCSRCNAMKNNRDYVQFTNGQKLLFV